MIEFIRQFFIQAKSVFNKLDARQKVVVLSVSLFSVAVIVFLMSWAGEQQWTVLQSNLRPEDAQRIVEYLKEQDVTYKLETEGTAILVPQGTELELRLEIHKNGLITGGVVGYEIFDRPSIGMTDFIQQVNYKRALEGEISRTIRALDMVEFARVQIVVPKSALFVQDQKPATATVLLTLKPGTQLSVEQINAIASMVSYSVEGLTPENVMISDSFGNNLSKVITKDPLIALKSEQLGIKSAIEREMRTKLETTLDELLGPGNAVVNVAVEMDFTQAKTTSKTYDPVSQVVRAQELQSSTGGLKDTVGQVSEAERTTTNYEMNETIRNTIDEFGKITRVTASVNINERYIEGDDGEKIYQPSTQEELNTIEESIINSIGLDLNRGDQVSVRELRFNRTILEEQEARLREQQRNELIKNFSKWFSVGVTFILVFFVLRSIFRSLDLLLPKPKPKPAIDIEAEAIEEEISAEAQRRAQMLDQVSRFTREKPSNVASLLITWLIEERS